MLHGRRQAGEVIRVTADAHHQIAILIRMGLGQSQRLMVDEGALRRQAAPVVIQAEAHLRAPAERFAQLF